MRFFLFVEGSTEQEALVEFLHQWIEKTLKLPVGISVARFQGVGEYLSRIKNSVDLLLSGPKQKEIIAAIGLLDLYGTPILPRSLSYVEKAEWGKRHIEGLVRRPKFKQYFAVHETEAWLLADEKILPRPVREALPTRCKNPESVNLNEPPAKLLDRLYRKTLNKGYRKTVDGKSLFARCSPQVVADKCPHFRMLLVDLEQLARKALKKNK